MLVIAVCLLLAGSASAVRPVREDASSAADPASDNKMRGCHVTFINKLANTTLAVVAVSDQKDESGPPVFVAPGQAGFFSRPFRVDSQPDMRLRIYTTKQGAQGGLVMDQMRQVYVCYNPSFEWPYFGVHAKPFERDGQLFNQYKYYQMSEGRSLHMHDLDQKSYVQRLGDSDDHKIFQVELHELSFVKTGDYPVRGRPVPA